MGHFCGALAGLLVGVAVLDNRVVETWETWVEFIMLLDLPQICLCCIWICISPYRCVGAVLASTVFFWVSQWVGTSLGHSLDSFLVSLSCCPPWHQQTNCFENASLCSCRHHYSSWGHFFVRSIPFWLWSNISSIKGQEYLSTTPIFQMN